MALLSRTAAKAAMALLYLLAQFPIATIPVAEQFRAEMAAPDLPISVVQVAVAAYASSPRGPRGLLGALLLPGSAVHYALQVAACEARMGAALGVDCAAPPPPPRWQDVLGQVAPRVYRPDIVLASVDAAFRHLRDLVLAGCSLTLGSTILSLGVPIKMGFFGYAMMLFVVFKAGYTPSLHSIVFALLLAVAADVFALVGLAPPSRTGMFGVAPRGSAAATAALNDAMATARASAARDAKAAKRRAPRDTVSAAEAKKAA